MTRSPLRAMILQLASGQDGVGTSEVPGYSIKQVGRAVEAMLLAGKLYKARGHGRWMRYYTSKAAAEMRMELWENSRQIAVRQSVELIAEWGPDEPTIYPPGYKHTICPPSRMGEFVTNTHKDW